MTDASASPSEDSTSQSFRVRGRIDPWHHDELISVRLREGTPSRVEGNSLIYDCPDGKHKVITPLSGM